jgi:hypothetical protein
MHSTPHRTHPATVLGVLVGCALLSALALGAVTLGIAAVVGASPVLTIAGIVAAAVFVVNLVALSLAVTRGEADARIVLVPPVAEPVAAVHARAS